MEEEADDCYSPAFPLDRFKHSRYLQMVEERAEEVNRHNLPPEVKHTMIPHVKYVQSYVQMGFPYRLHLALARINDTKQSEISNSDCVPQTNTRSLLTEALIEAQQWFNTRSFMVKHKDIIVPPVLAQNI